MNKVGLKIIFKKYKIVVIVVILISGIGFFIGEALSNQVMYHGNNTANIMNKNRSKNLIKGVGYTLNDEMKLEIRNQKIKAKCDYERKQKYLDKTNKRMTATKNVYEDNETKKSQYAENQNNNAKPDEKSSDVGENSNNGGGNDNEENEQAGGSGEHDQDNENDGGQDDEKQDDENSGGQDDEEQDNEDTDDEIDEKAPIIKTNLVDGKTYNTEMTFVVEAMDYQQRAIEASHFRVSLNGELLISSGSLYQRSYKPTLNEGENTITISVTDTGGQMAQKSFKIYGSDDEERKLQGEISVTIEAGSIGLGNLINGKKIKFYEGESISMLIDRAITESGYTYLHAGTVKNGWYIQRINKEGITDGFNIPVPIQERLDEAGSSWMGAEHDSLGEKDFFDGSGWIYLYNNEFLGRGMSDVDLNDGDEVTIAFTTHYGYEYDGTWFDGSW